MEEKPTNSIKPLSIHTSHLHPDKRSYEVDVCVHTVADILSKNVFGALGYILVYQLLPKEDSEVDEADHGYRIDLEAASSDVEYSSSITASNSGEVAPKRLQLTSSLDSRAASPSPSPPSPRREIRRGSVLVSSSSRRRRRSSVPNIALSTSQQQAQGQQQEQQQGRAEEQQALQQQAAQQQRQQQQQEHPRSQQIQMMPTSAMAQSGIIHQPREQDGLASAATNEVPAWSGKSAASRPRQIIIIEDVPIM